ncbi:hypothetical protein [Parafrankia discariae]|uniref:hypothetical protein n=1 Tax=Parafrankia discariae TaxID=365528 RepID=UPI0003A84AD6|nr:hypothetical protein [Parafrankia discariae]
MSRPGGRWTDGPAHPSRGGRERRDGARRHETVGTWESRADGQASNAGAREGTTAERRRRAGVGYNLVEPVG